MNELFNLLDGVAKVEPLVIVKMTITATGRPWYAVARMVDNHTLRFIVRRRAEALEERNKKRFITRRLHAKRETI